MSKTIAVAIIGGGVSGLSADGLLAQKGLKVKPFETNDKLGEVVQTRISADTLFTMMPISGFP